MAGEVSCLQRDTALSVTGELLMWPSALTVHIDQSAWNTSCPLYKVTSHEPALDCSLSTFDALIAASEA